MQPIYSLYAVELYNIFVSTPTMSIRLARKEWTRLLFVFREEYAVAILVSNTVYDI